MNCIIFSVFLGCSESFMHLIDFTKHLKQNHTNKSSITCSICSVQLYRSPLGFYDLNHLDKHKISLCNCAYCEFTCNKTEIMHNHLSDKHPTRLAFTLMRMPNGAANTHQEPSIVHYEDDKWAFKFPPYSDAQLNFMDPALQCEINENTPMTNHSERVRRAEQFRTILNATSEKSLELKKQYNVRSLLFMLSKPTVAQNSAENEETIEPSDTETNTANPSDTYGDIIQAEIDSSAKAILMDTGIEPDCLFRCSVEKCGWVQSATCEREFLAHLSQHRLELSQYTCYHCNSNFQMANDLKNHMKSHLKHRFFCFYCDMTGNTQKDMNDHFMTIHTDNTIRYIALNPNKIEMATDLFVACPSGGDTFDKFINRLIKRAGNKMETKKKFYPHECHLLPKRAIFPEEVECGLCSFRNKVRQNMLRHLKNGCSEQQTQAPVNPVPCLNTGERHFDKMKNLAASSNSSNLNNIEHGLGKFVADKDRYACFASSCNYRNLSADLLKQHIITLHKSEHLFSCPHCDENTSSSATDILTHLRYHESKIFKCPNCTFIHYLKAPVEKHITDQHPNSREKAIALDRPLKKEEPSKTKSLVFKWNCNVCSTTFSTRALVKRHLIDNHRISFQYRCSVCNFSNDTKNAVKEHLVAEHNAEYDPNRVKCHYDRIECDVDNTPIWRRDDPTRVSTINCFASFHHSFGTFSFRLVFSLF